MKLAPSTEDEQALETLKFCDYSIKISKEMAISGTGSILDLLLMLIEEFRIHRVF